MDPLASERDPVLMTTPLAQRYYTDDEGVGGRVKVHPADFRVEEIPIYEPCGEGEHLYLRVQKTRVAHAELISCLRRAFDVPHKAIGFAGMKDKRAVTTQTISIQMHEDPPSLEIDHERIKILWAERHRNKIRRGHLKGNRFSIFIRDTDPMKAPRADRMLRKLERIGTPGYYGSQRFGYRLNNHLMGAALLREDWEGFLRELLGTTGSPFPKHQRERRTMFDEGRYKEAAALWTPADRAELVTVRKLAAGADAKTAVLAIRRADLSFYSTALASAIYNRTLDQRIEDGTADKLIEGDLAWKHDSRAVFPVTAEELASGELPGRLESMEISPSGPLWGYYLLSRRFATYCVTGRRSRDRLLLR